MSGARLQRYERLTMASRTWDSLTIVHTAYVCLYFLPAEQGTTPACLPMPLCLLCFPVLRLGSSTACGSWENLLFWPLLLYCILLPPALCRGGVPLTSYPTTELAGKKRGGGRMPACWPFPSFCTGKTPRQHGKTSGARCLPIPWQHAAAAATLKLLCHSFVLKEKRKEGALFRRYGAIPFKRRRDGRAPPSAGRPCQLPGLLYCHAILFRTLCRVCPVILCHALYVSLQVAMGSSFCLPAPVCVEGGGEGGEKEGERRTGGFWGAIPCNTLSSPALSTAHLLLVSLKPVQTCLSILYYILSFSLLSASMSMAGSGRSEHARLVLLVGCIWLCVSLAASLFRKKAFG